MNPHLCLLGDANSVHVRRWAGEMQARGFRVSVVTGRPQPIDGVEQRVVEPVKRSVDWLLRTAQVRRHLDDLAPDIVHAHYVTSYGYLAARCGRRPMVMTAWGSDILVSPRESRLIRWLTRWILRQADLVTGDSEDLIEAIAEYGPRGRVEQIHWGVDMTKFRPVPWAEKVGFRVVSLRAWEANYRIDRIIEGVALFAGRHPDAGVHLYLLGGGTQESMLRALVKELGLTEQVSFVGRVGDVEMVAYLDRCKASISLPVSDATSVSVLESMASGVPVVASDLPANRQWLGDDDGLLIAGGDSSAVAAALEGLWRDDGRARQIGSKNNLRMKHEGSRAVQMDAVASLYHQLLERKKAGHIA